MHNEDLVIIPDTSAASSGDFLSFDGTDLEWANPPEGVYVINYTEVTDIRDVDVDRATTQPTFLKIDTEEPLTISVPTGSGTSYTVYLRPGTLMSLDEVGVVITSGSYTGPKFLMFGSTYGKEISGGVMQNADFKITCAISLSDFSGVSKSLTVGGNLDAGGQLFNGGQPFPITTTFFGGKGPGNPATNQSQNALGITFQSHGNMRQQLLMPAEIQDHNFANDSTPEQVQFMGWGVTSNRAGYRTINEVPASTSAESGKVLMVDSAGSPEWNTNVFIANYYQTPFADILAAKNRGAIILLLMPTPNMYGPLMTLFNMTDTFAYFTAVSPGTTSSPSELWTVEVSTDGTTDTWSSPIINKCAQLGSITIKTDSSPVMIRGLNNYLGTMSLNRSSFTLIVEVDDGEVVNFGLEIENSQSCQLTIQKKVGNTITTLKHSVAGGNTLEANKTYQVTAVGNCWTLAEFEA